MGVWVKKRCEKLRIRSFGAGIFPFKCPCPETFRDISVAYFDTNEIFVVHGVAGWVGMLLTAAFAR
jgi:ammonia channel protein AmtB